MKLYLVRHGEAVSEDIDPTRPLSEKGKADTLKVAGFLRAAGIQKVGSIWHSTKARAIQTARIFAETMAHKECLVEKEGLAPNDPPDKLPEELSAQETDLMIVGHLPFLQKLISLLLVGSESHKVVSFHQGGVVCLECKGDGKWWLLWAIAPELIKGG